MSGMDAPVCSFVVILERFDTSTTVDEFLLSAAAKPRKMARFAIEMYSGLRSCRWWSQDNCEVFESAAPRNCGLSAELHHDYRTCGCMSHKITAVVLGVINHTYGTV